MSEEVVAQKKKILFQSDYSCAKTGFGRASKTLLEYLYRTGKYDITHYCCGMQYSHPDLSRTPWRSIGCLPDNPNEMESLNRDPMLARDASYGAYLLNKVVEEVQPDIYLAAQDIWGVDFAINRPWFSRINSFIWTTLDSLPILESAVEAAKKAENYWIWSSFATEALHKLGQSHVKTVHGPIDSKSFYRLDSSKRAALRAAAGISPDTYVVGFVFRNQLRKSVPNLLEGFKLFKQRTVGGAPSKLLLHTHFGEGWKIPKLAAEYEIDMTDILTTYICRACAQYHVSSFSGIDKACPHCKNDKSCTTTQPGIGVSEEALNEVYNLMDVYCHPFTSGGQEIPIQEAKLTELITLVTNYSCGVEMCQESAASFPLDYSEYREPQTEFIKASTSPASIAKQLVKVYNMDDSSRREMGRKARKWALENFSVDVVGKYIEQIFDALPAIDYKNISFEEERRDPLCVVPEIADNSEWITFLYHNILKRPGTDRNDAGHQYWAKELEKGMPRASIEEYFRGVARQENEKSKPVDLKDFLGDEPASERMLFVIPESIGDVFLCTSLFENLRKTNGNRLLYVATKPEYFSILDGNPHVHKVIPFLPMMDNLLLLEGRGGEAGYFDIAFLPHIGTQRILDYMHNGKDSIALNINP